MAVARLVAAPFPLAASRARAPPARLRPFFAPLPLVARRAAVPVLRVASDGRAEAPKEDEAAVDAPARMALATERKARKESERRTYLVAAVMSSLGITSMAAAAVYYRFAWQMEGLGITLFGMAYMFVHDGLVHRRFPVGPIENVPYFRRVAAAHQIHHMDKFDSVPYGLFLGPKELEEVGGTEELEKEIQRRIKRRAMQ